MSELTDKVTDKVVAQYEQLNNSLNKVLKAGRGLFFNLKKESTKQFNDLVTAGEKAEENEKGIVEEVKATIADQLGDVKGSASKARLATLGLLSKAKENGGKYFQDLVEVAENTQKTATSAVKSKTKAKSTSSKAA